MWPSHLLHESFIASNCNNNQGVPEKLISEKSGHKSVKALRVYERTSEVQHKSAGKCVQAGQSFETASTSAVSATEMVENRENTEFEITCGHRPFSVHLPQTAVGTGGRFDNLAKIESVLVTKLLLRNSASNYWTAT